VTVDLIPKYDGWFWDGFAVKTNLPWSSEFVNVTQKYFSSLNPELLGNYLTQNFRCWILTKLLEIKVLKIKCIQM
jgi:hypothetical protein